MKFIDEAVVYVQAGRGGNGACSFRREKFVPRGGPDGGNGGRGGSVIIEATSSKRTLIDFKYREHFRAEDGGHGSGQNKTGKSGSDIFLHVPHGTELYNTTTGECIGDLTSDGEHIIIAHGGKGGKGNTRFKSSTNQAPRKCEQGEAGESLKLRLELKVIADVGILGFPNVGKSTFLSRVSNAKPKIADYPFTTLYPELGLVRVDDDFDFVLADMPGLLENASEGVGLGIRFLKHLQRTKMLLHFLDVSGDSTQKKVIKNYHTLNIELEKYGNSLIEKEQIVVLTKYDACDEKENISSLVEYFQDLGKTVVPISSVTSYGVKNVLMAIRNKLNTM